LAHQFEKISDISEVKSQIILKQSQFFLATVYFQVVSRGVLLLLDG